MPSSEVRIIARHAGTVLVGQLAVMAFGIVDTIVAGRYADSALAALSIGAAIYVSVYVSLMGVLQSLLPVYAQLHGARQHERLGQTFRQSLYLATLLLVLGMGIMLQPTALLRWTQVPEALLATTQGYLQVLAWALIPSLFFRMYSSLNQGLGKPLLVTWLQLGSLAVKVPLTVWFTFGGAGLPAMGVEGCAWATFCVNWLMLGTALILLRKHQLYAPLALWQPMEAPNGKQLLQFARIGLPGGLAYLVEITSFTLMALFIARLGTVASAGHQIASNVAGSLYMVPLSLSVACSARVSYWIGAGDAAKAQALVWLGVRMALIMAGSLALLVAVFAHGIAGLYSANSEVVAMGASLLIWVAAYHFADALQAICAFLLRCYKVTLLPLAVYSVMLWGLGLYGGYLLAYEGLGGVSALHTASAFWLTGTIAIAIVATLFIAMLAYLTPANQRNTD